jgi:hypothetical protein
MTIPLTQHKISFKIEICDYLPAHGLHHAAALTGKIDVRNYVPKEVA